MIAGEWSSGAAEPQRSFDCLDTVDTDYATPSWSTSTAVVNSHVLGIA